MSLKIKFIKCVQKYPELYRKTQEITESESQILWHNVALQCSMFSPESARDLWKELTQDYINYLTNGKSFEFAKEMEFLQTHLFNTLEDFDIDENELLRAIAGTEDADEGTQDSDNAENNPKICKIQQNSAAAKQSDNEARAKKQESKTLKHTADKKAEAPRKSADEIHITNQSDHNAFTNLSPLELLFLSYAKQLQKMPLKLKLRTKRMIADIMDDAEMEMMDEM